MCLPSQAVAAAAKEDPTTQLFYCGIKNSNNSNNNSSKKEDRGRGRLVWVRHLLHLLNIETNTCLLLKMVRTHKQVVVAFIRLLSHQILPPDVLKPF